MMPSFPSSGHGINGTAARSCFRIAAFTAVALLIFLMAGIVVLLNGRSEGRDDHAAGMEIASALASLMWEKGGASNDQLGLSDRESTDLIGVSMNRPDTIDAPMYFLTTYGPTTDPNKGPLATTNATNDNDNIVRSRSTQ